MSELQLLIWDIRDDRYHEWFALNYDVWLDDEAIRQIMDLGHLHETAERWYHNDAHQ